MRVYWINGFGEECESKVYAAFARLGEVFVVVNDWRACAPIIVPIESIIRRVRVSRD